MFVHFSLIHKYIGLIVKSFEESPETLFSGVVKMSKMGADQNLMVVDRGKGVRIFYSFCGPHEWMNPYCVRSCYPATLFKKY